MQQLQPSATCIWQKHCTEAVNFSAFEDNDNLKITLRSLVLCFLSNDQTRPQYKVGSRCREPHVRHVQTSAMLEPLISTALPADQDHSMAENSCKNIITCIILNDHLPGELVVAGCSLPFPFHLSWNGPYSCLISKLSYPPFSSNAIRSFLNTGWQLRDTE